MTVALYVLFVVLFALGLGISIALHECGHMIPAKRFGVRVPHFFVGFGKTVWSTRRGETEYGVKAFPLGGFVKLVGMIPPDPDPRPREERGRQGFLKQLVHDVRDAEQQLIEPGDEHRVFYKLPTWQKVVVMAGGPLVNVAIAFFLFAGVFALHGVEETTTTVKSVSDCVVAVKLDDKTPPKCTAQDPDSPAELAGIKAGDRILSVNGEKIDDYAELQRLIRANGAGVLALQVERGGKTLDLRANTAINDLPSLDPESKKSVKAGFLGISPLREDVTHGPLWTAGTMVDYTGETLKALAHMPVRLWGVGRAVLGLQERDQDSPMSVVGAGRVAGEIGSDTDEALGDRIAFLIVLLAGVNLFVGMFNFVPLPPLDGGHIAGALYEGARRGLARLFRRPDPGHFDVAKLLPVAYVMVGVFLVMTVLLVYADLVIPVNV